MRASMHPLQFQNVVGAAHARGRVDKCVLIGDAGELRDVAIQKPVRFAHERRAVLVVVSFAEQADKGEVVVWLELKVDVAADRRLAAGLERNAKTARFGGVERRAVAIRQILALGVGCESVAPAQVGSRAERLERCLVVEGSGADAQVEGGRARDRCRPRESGR